MDKKAKLFLKNFRYEQLSHPPLPFPLDLSLQPLTQKVLKKERERKREKNEKNLQKCSERL